MNERVIRLQALIGDDAITKLKEATVAVVGLGGVGGAALLTLVRCGVGNLIIQDFDIVCESNFNRQVIANTDTLGQYKTDVASEMIKKINPLCNVTVINEPFNKQSKLFNYHFDYLIDCIDDFENKMLLIKTALDNDITIISAMGAAKKLDCTKLSVMEIMKTTYDPIAKKTRQWLKENKINKKLYVVSSTEEPHQTTTLGSYMPVVAYAGLLLADYIIKKIIGE